MDRKRRIAVSLDLDEPFAHHHDVYAGVRQYAGEHPGWQCVIDEHPLYRRSSRREHFRHYDGVIARAPRDLARRLKRLGVPLVNTWYAMAQPDVPCVSTDWTEIGRIGAQHLMGRGFRRFCVLNQVDDAHAILIGDTFAELVRREGLACLVQQHPAGSFNDAAHWLAMEKLLDECLGAIAPPFGVFTVSPSVALLLIDLCRARRWAVPQDVAVLCVYDVKAISTTSSPQISCFERNLHHMGYEAAALLDRLMDGQPPPTEPILIPPGGITVRESTDYFAVEDRVVAESLRYISRNLRSRLTVSRVAKAIAVSPRHLQMRFSDALGRPVSGEIRRLRLEAAKRMLAEEDRQISEIARLTGFRTSIAMSKVFNRVLGSSPSAYRKRVLGQRGD